MMYLLTIKLRTAILAFPDIFKIALQKNCVTAKSPVENRHIYLLDTLGKLLELDDDTHGRRERIVEKAEKTSTMVAIRTVIMCAGKTSKQMR